MGGNVLNWGVLVLFSLSVDSGFVAQYIMSVIWRYVGMVPSEAIKPSVSVCLLFLKPFLKSFIPTCFTFTSEIMWNISVCERKVTQLYLWKQPVFTSVSFIETFMLIFRVVCNYCLIEYVSDLCT